MILWARGAGPRLASALVLLSALLGAALAPAGPPPSIGVAAPAVAISEPLQSVAVPSPPPTMQRPLLGAPPTAALAPPDLVAPPERGDNDGRLLAYGVRPLAGAVVPQEQGSQATLETRRPDVQWSPAGAGAWQSVPDRQVVMAGDRVRTGPGAEARLVYFEGTVTEIGPETGLLVQRLERGADGNLVTSLFQTIGTTVSHVIRLADRAADFEVETPAATAFVRGTTPRVIVADDGTTRVANVPDGSESIVVIQGKDPNRSEVRLPPGLETIVRPGLPPQAPAPMQAAEPSAPGAAAGESQTQSQTERQQRRQQQQARAREAAAQAQAGLVAVQAELDRLTQQEAALAQQVQQLLASAAPGLPPPSSGQSPCTTVVGQVCTVTGPQVSGTTTKIGSATFVITATGLVGAQVGGVPTVFIPTTVRVEQFPCAPVTASLTAQCSGQTVGDPLQGGTVTVRYPRASGDTADATGIVAGPGPASPTATGTRTSTATVPATPTSAGTATPTATPTVGPTSTATSSPTATSTAVSSPTASPTAVPTATPTTSATSTPVATASLTPTITPSPTESASPTVSATITPTPTDTSTPSPTPSATATATETATPTATETGTPSPTETGTPSPTPSPTATSTPSPTATVTPTATATPPPTATSTALPTATATSTATPVPCNTTTNSGGAGVTRTAHNLGATSGTFRFTYNAFQVPDQFDINYEGIQIFTTGFVTGSNANNPAQVTYAGMSTTIEVVVTSSPGSVIWTYTVFCPT